VNRPARGDALTEQPGYLTLAARQRQPVGFRNSAAQ
jgi:hypothetical protein